MPPMLTIPDPIKKLVLLPRFWLTVIGVVTSAYLYIKGQITAEVLVGAIVTLAGIVLTVLTVENVNAANNTAKVQMNQATANAQVAMAESQVRVAELSVK